MLVVLDIGHVNERGGGARANGLVEAECNLRVAEAAREQLAASGLEVEMTSPEIPGGLAGVVRWINALHAKRPVTLVVSIHHNAASNPDANGVEAVYVDGWPETRSLAERLARHVAAASGLVLRGTIPDNRTAVGRLGILRDTQPLAALVECGFLTNPNDASAIRAYPGKFGLGIARAVMEHVGLDGASEAEEALEVGGVTIAVPEFAKFFRDCGGIRTFGLPLAPAQEIDGRLCQVFERYVMELHPEEQGPWRVMGRRLGVEFWQRLKEG